MKRLRTFSAVALATLAIGACQSPPPGTVVFEDKSKAEEVVLKSHGMSKDDLEGLPVIKIQTESIGEPGDTLSPYVEPHQRPARF